jgi:hypothetical protein
MNNELDPKLKKKLESLREVPERRLQRSLSGREDFLAFAKTRKPYQPPIEKRRRVNAKSSRRSWIPRLAGVLAAVLLALFSIGGTVYASQASLPDDLLYPVKILTEDIQVSLETDPEDKLDLHVSFASRRLQEIQAQVEAGEEVSEKALRLLDKHTQKMLQEAAQMGEQGLNNALRQIEENLQNQMMEMLQKKHPHGGAPGLVKAQEKIRSRLELVENGIEEPKGFKENIHKDGPDNPGQGNKNGNDNPNKPETPPGLIDKDKNEKNQGQGKGNNNNNGVAPTGTSTSGDQGTE